jgi:hypothetical protein
LGRGFVAQPLTTKERSPMPLATKKEMKHIGESRAMADHDRDLVHELTKRLDSVWRYDQYIANAKDHAELVHFWRSAKAEDQKNVELLRGLIKAEIERDCF